MLNSGPWYRRAICLISNLLKVMWADWNFAMTSMYWFLHEYEISLD